MAWLGLDTALLVFVFYVVVISLAEQVRIAIVLRITDMCIIMQVILIG